MADTTAITAAFTTVRSAPKLESISGYNLWRHAMKNYLVDRKLEDVLDLEISDWKSIMVKVDLHNSKSRRLLYDQIGVKVREPELQPKMKVEDKKEVEMKEIPGVPAVSTAEVKMAAGEVDRSMVVEPNYIF